MSETVDNKVTVLVLQHPQEQDHVLGTAGLLCRTLANAKLAVGLSWRNLAHAAGQGPLVAVDRKGATLPNQEMALSGLKGLVVLDGNWAQAKALWWRNAWLTKLRRFVVVPDGPSLYGSLRREARPDAVSTLEATALALSAVEESPAIRERILVPFRAMIAKARAAGAQGGKRDRRRRL